MTFLLDTNIVSELTRREPSRAVIDFLNNSSDLAISVIVFHELEFGIQCIVDQARKAKLQAFAQTLRQRFAGRIVDVSLLIAETAGRFRASEKSLGRVLAELDALIAATAMVQGWTLVTRNVKDFEKLNISLLNPWDEPKPETGKVFPLDM